MTRARRKALQKKFFGAYIMILDFKPLGNLSPFDFFFQSQFDCMKKVKKKDTLNELESQEFF